MLTFTNLTPQEFLRLNADSIPPEVLRCFDEFHTTIAELEDKLQIIDADCESMNDQLHYASKLIKELDYFAENNLLNDDLEMYNQIRENTYFEV